MLIANNASLDNEMRESFYRKTVEYGYKTLDAIETLEHVAPCKENNDSDGILSLIRSYAYRNIFVSKQFIGDSDAGEWLKKSLSEREKLKNNFIGGTIDTQLYNTFCMEYYLALVNYFNYTKDEIDEFEKYMMRKDIERYLDSIVNNQSRNAFITQIEAWVKKSA